MWEQIDVLDDALKPEDKGPPSISEDGTIPVAELLSQVLNHPQLCALIRIIMQEEAVLIYAL